MTDLTPERRAEWRMAASGPSRGININSRVLLALLDDADERDRLAAVIGRVQALVPIDVSDWDEDDPLMVPAAAIHRALDGTEDPT